MQLKNDDTAIHLRAWHANVGALVADAASLGFHWLYDQPLIAKHAQGTPHFHSPLRSEYEDKGYFAHEGKEPGDCSHYGAQMITLLDSLSERGDYDELAYINSFRSWFDFGGAWQGYIDKPTKLTLLNIHHLEAQQQDFVAVGADDFQNPATAKLPPLVAHYYQSEDLLDLVETAVRVTNNNDRAVLYAKACALMIQAALLGKTPKHCVAAASVLGGEISKSILAVNQLRDISSMEVAARVGMHCDLDVSFQVICHLLLSSKNFTTTIDNNILCGGDSCGRAIVLGAVLGASYQGTDKAIPSEWIAKTNLPQSVFTL